MHIGKQTSETTYNESKTECLYVPTAKELNQRTIEMELSKDDILLTAEEEEQSETQRMRRRKLEDKIYESSSETLPVEVEGGIITYCPDFKYLGDWLSYNLKADKALEMRKAAMTKAIGSLKVFFDRKEVCLRSKYLIFMTIPINYLLWGCESWALCKRHLNMLQSFVNRKIRRILKLTMWDVKEQRITNEQLLQRFCNMPSIQTLIDIRTVQYLGKITCGQVSAPPRHVLIAYVDSKRPKGRPLKCNRECMRDSLARLLKDVVGIFIDEMGSLKDWYGMH